MFAHTALRFANHVLAGERWARNRLQAFAGQMAQLRFGKLLLPVMITDAGMLAVGDLSGTASVTIILPADAPWRALTDRASLLGSAHISGSAELAETLGFVFRNLRWDAEDDLSRLVGDVAARRLAQGGRQFAQWHLKRAQNLALNISEYLTEETPAIARRRDVACFCGGVDLVQDDCKRLETRLQRLENN